MINVGKMVGKYTYMDPDDPARFLFIDGCWIFPRSSTLMLQCGKVGISQALACLGGVGDGWEVGWVGFDDGWVF